MHGNANMGKICSGYTRTGKRKSQRNDSSHDRKRRRVQLLTGISRGGGGGGRGRRRSEGYTSSGDLDGREEKGEVDTLLGDYCRCRRSGRPPTEAKANSQHRRRTTPTHAPLDIRPDQTRPDQIRPNLTGHDTTGHDTTHRPLIIHH